MANDYNRDHQNDVDVINSRDTFQNHNFLAPAKQQAQIVLYDAVLKLVQQDQVVTGLMTTTTRLDVSHIDTNGERAEYTQQCHGLIARHRNKALRRDDYFWTRGGPDETVLCDDPDKALEQLARMFCRPIEDALVEDLRHWDGAKILPDHWGEPLVITPFTQSERATYQKAIKVTPMPPLVLQRRYSVEECKRLANEAIAKRAAELNATRLKRTGSSRVLGRAACNKLDPLTCSHKPRRRHEPHFFGRDEQVREAMKELRAKRRFYATCRELFAGDHKDVVFAAGTVMMRKLGAYCDPLPPTTVTIPPWEFVPPPKN